MDLLEALKRPEGKTLEFKRDLSSPDGVLRTIVAFANTAGGTLLVGVEDASRHVRGVAEPLALEERLASLISDTIEPRLAPDLEVLPWRRTHVLAIQVYPSPSRPHYLRREGLEAGVYVRVGSTNRRADRELIEELRRFARGASFDEQAMPDLDSEALDFRAASESFAPLRKLKRGDLETLRLLTTHQGRTVPTVAGVLLFGKDRARHFPDAWIQAGRFRGMDKARIVDHLEIRSLPVPAIEAAIAFVYKHAIARRRDRRRAPHRALEPSPRGRARGRHQRRGACGLRSAGRADPVVPLRRPSGSGEPGLLPFGLTVDDLYRGVSKLRNRAIGRAFHELGLVEQWGSGIQRMAAACRDAGLAPPAGGGSPPASVSPCARRAPPRRPWTRRTRRILTRLRAGRGARPSRSPAPSGSPPRDPDPTGAAGGQGLVRRSVPAPRTRSGGTRERPPHPGAPRLSFPGCVSGLVCVRCGRRYLRRLDGPCAACGPEGVLEIEFDLARARRTLTPRALRSRPRNAWRYEELLPVPARRAAPPSSPAGRRSWRPPGSRSGPACGGCSSRTRAGTPPPPSRTARARWVSPALSPVARGSWPAPRPATRRRLLPAPRRASACRA